nr:uncharacterized protein C15orf57 homolog isoform X2 [Microcebus murinus]XP_020141535.1 uncharacterized protein C15orf57 homolog isoform X2 [Microcebus murinus]
MKMFEGVDCTSTRSSRDLWAEICSCLPNPDQEDGASNAFSDSFVDSYPESEGQRGAAAFAVELPIKPWAPLQDSEMYLASLDDYHCKVQLALTSDGRMMARSHPSVDIAYEHTKPVPRPDPVHSHEETMIKC